MMRRTVIGTIAAAALMVIGNTIPALHQVAYAVGAAGGLCWLVIIVTEAIRDLAR